MCRAQFPRGCKLMKCQHNIKGFSLPIVMIMMLVLAIMVLAATQVFNTESRLSSNDADRKMTMQVAEATLRQGEQAIVDQDLVGLDKKAQFISGCSNEGLCLPSQSGQAVWEGGSNSLLEQKGKKYTAPKQDTVVYKDPQYVIEWISDDSEQIVYRVTARAWGENAYTVVTLQSYVAADI